MLRIFIIIAIMAVAASASASGINISKSQLIEAGKNDKITAYVIKESRTVNADGSIGFDALYQYSPAGSKILFASVKKADRPVVSVTTFHVKCDQSKMKAVYSKMYSQTKDVFDGPVKGGKYSKIGDGSVESAVAEVACRPDFE
ncbi:MAG: hypothetical protein CXR31_14705 [Geobacter sp.]|nr:MAG: hypothetical protein CXR31_14705 [Geobacter sp.]